MSKFTKINAHRLTLDGILEAEKALGIVLEGEIACCSQRIEAFGKQIDENLQTLAGLPEDAAKFIALERALQSNQYLYAIYKTMNPSQEREQTETHYQALEECLNKNNITVLNDKTGKTANHLADLCRKVKNAHDKITDIEKKTITRIVEESLNQLGYKTEIKGNEETLIRAENKEQSIAVTVDKKAVVAFDMAGFADNHCEKEAEKLMRQFEQRGLKIIKKQTQFKNPSVMKKQNGFNPLKTSRVMHTNRLIHYIKQKIKL